MGGAAPGTPFPLRPLGPRLAEGPAGIAGAGRPWAAAEQVSKEPRELTGPLVDHDKLAFAGVGRS